MGGYGATTYYSLIMQYPFSAWGEAFIVLLQCTAILFMFWHFADGLWLYPRLVAFVGWMVCSLWLLTVELPPWLETGIGLAPAGLFAAARVPQVWQNFRQGHTGQLAPATFALQL